MALNSGTPTDLPELLAAVRVKLADTTGISRHLVFPTLWPDDELAARPPGDRFITIKPTRAGGIAGITAGAGRTYRAYDGRLLVCLYYRLPGLDQYLRDAEALERAVGGIAGAWMLVCSALEQFVPIRSSDATAALVIEPMRNDPGFEIPTRKGPATGWHRWESTWEMKFVQRLS